VASVDVQLIVELLPYPIDCGEAKIETVGAGIITEQEVFVYVPDIVPEVQVLVCEMEAQVVGEVTEEVEYAVLEYPEATFPQGVPVQPGVQEVAR
jgi:hypothetical protein